MRKQTKHQRSVETKNRAARKKTGADIDNAKQTHKAKELAKSKGITMAQAMIELMQD